MSPIFNKILFRSNRNRIFEANVLEKNDVSIDSFRSNCIIYSLLLLGEVQKIRKRDRFKSREERTHARGTKRRIDLRGRELFRPQFRRKLGEENSFVRIKYVPYPVSRISRRISVGSKSEHDSIMDPRWPRYIRSITPCVAIQLCRTN